jgi:uncharacterized membrane protein
MRVYVASIALAIGGNALYHFSQKSIPAVAPPLLSLLVTYAVALLATVLLLPFWPESRSVGNGLRSLNWASVAVGLAIVAIELGFLLAYRSGWRMSVGSVVVNVSVALLLVPVGLFAFRERLSSTNALGIVLCIAGLILLARR